jgi:hypoxanthine phosphoribosyltransferase
LNRRLKVLIGEEEIRKRVRELGKEILESFSSPTVTVISVLKGALLFTADLIRSLNAQVEVDFIGIKSYKGRSKGEVKITSCPGIPLEGKEVLIVDDIFDTGESLFAAYREILKERPYKVKTCVLLEKEVERKVSITPDFVGFKIPDCYVVGYGLDLDEKFRNLPYIACFEGDGD